MITKCNGNFAQINENLGNYYKKTFEGNKNRLRRKFENLNLDLIKQNKTPPFDKDVVVNVSSYPLTETEAMLLQKGLNFAVAPKLPPMIDIAASTEQFLKTHSFTETDRQDIRYLVKQHLQKKQKSEISNLSVIEKFALKNLKNNKYNNSECG